MGTASVGEVPKTSKDFKPEIHSMKFQVHDFANRTEKRDESFVTPILKAHGHPWNLQIYPRGDSRTPTNPEYVSCFLLFKGDKNQGPFVKFTFRCKGSPIQTASANFTDRKTKDGWGYTEFARRDDVLANYIDENGTLTIEVDMQIAVDTVWYPKEVKQQETLIDLYHSPACSDVVFLVDGKQFNVHKCVLAKRCNTLLEFVKENKNSNVEVDNVDKEIFDTIVQFIYTVKQPEFPDANTAKTVLLAADRFGLVDLKLLAESHLVDKFLDAENAAELLLFADSHSCALLKESAMNKYVSDEKSVMASDAWSLVKESPQILHDLLEYALKWYRQETSTDQSQEENIDHYLTVTTLRRRLEKAGLDVDGSRQVLIKRLQASIDDE
jgi:hypothetical protein